MRKTKIVITLGPATESAEMIENLIEGGVNVFRLNFSHGKHESHAQSIARIRKISKKLNKEVAILQDISGPKVRIGEIDGILKLEESDILILSKHDHSDDQHTLALSCPQIIDMVNVGEEVYFADGTLQTVVTEKHDDYLKLRLLNDGELTSKKGVNFPKTKLQISSITPKDEDDIAFGARHDIDLVALSFVQSTEDIKKAKEIMKKHNFDPFIISKIETAEAIANLEEILKSSDGVMVARGDLGAEFGVTKLPRIQKHIIQMANELNKPSIVATQMLTSMKKHPFPTRAEVSDIANAVYDGTDAVMLSDETTVGKFPLEAVSVLHDSIKDVEVNYPYYKKFKIGNTSDAVSKSAVSLAKSLNKDSLVPFTTSGMSAQTLSRYRPKQGIYAVSHSLKTHRRLSLVWGIHPLFVMPENKNPTKMLYAFIVRVLDEGRVTMDSRFIVTMGSITGEKGTTNLIRLLNGEGMQAVLKYDC